MIYVHIIGFIDFLIVVLMYIEKYYTMKILNFSVEKLIQVEMMLDKEHRKMRRKVRLLVMYRQIITFISNPRKCLTSFNNWRRRLSCIMYRYI